MTADTIAINRKRDPFPGHSEIWLFGYGSLIYKADFNYLERRPATIRGWVRRFWQGSHDHRGTPDAPGRVVTLIEAPGERCGGMAYRISREVLDHLDVREKNGYLRLTTTMHFDDGSEADGLVYIATPDNAAFAGPAPEAAIARHIAASEGPSGANRDYLVRLAASLHRLGFDDPHVFAVEDALRSLDAELATGTGGQSG